MAVLTPGRVRKRSVSWQRLSGRPKGRVRRVRRERRIARKPRQPRTIFTSTSRRRFCAAYSGMLFWSPSNCMWRPNAISVQRTQTIGKLCLPHLNIALCCRVGYTAPNRLVHSKRCHFPIGRRGCVAMTTWPRCPGPRPRDLSITSNSCWQLL